MNPNDPKDPTNPHYNAPGSAPIEPAPAEITSAHAAAPAPASASVPTSAAASHAPNPSASNLNPELPPTYKQMLQEIGKQLNLRKSLLLKRTLFISWPGLVLVALIWGWTKLDDAGMLDRVPETAIVPIMIAGGAFLLFAIVYMVIAGFMFEIEKQIWIDSYFDKKELAPKQSWKIAKKLFWPAFRLRVRIAWNYYLLPGLIFALLLVGLGYWANKSGVSATYESNIWVLGTILLLVFLLVAVVYSYYIRVKIRYAWFVFLDIYKGEPFDTRVVLSQMNALNTASKSASFKKALVTEIGTDSAQTIANLAVSTIGWGMSHIPGVGEVLGGLTKAYGQELTRQATSLGKISALYLLYRFARKELFGSEQVSNEYVYQLISSQASATNAINSSSK